MLPKGWRRERYYICQVSNEKYDPCPDQLWSLRIAFHFEMCFLASYPNCNLSTFLQLTFCSLKYPCGLIGEVMFPFPSKKLCCVMLQCYHNMCCIIYRCESLRSCQLFTVTNRIRVKVAFWEPSSAPLEPLATLARHMASTVTLQRQQFCIYFAYV